jgi:tRNA (cmo5U34)-methyltransferase
MSDWSFSGFGPQFDAHVVGHLPHYDLTTDLAAYVASYALPRDGLVADLGCSTGQSIQCIAQSIPERQFRAVGYDLDESMLALAKDRLAGYPSVTFHVEHRDLVLHELEHEQANVTLALWTLQFLPLDSWHGVLARARERSHRDGVLLVAAKTRLPDARWQEIGDGAVADWKAAHGVTPEEALVKARSLRGTLLLATLGRLLDDIAGAGWYAPTVLFRWHAWVLIGAWADRVRETPESAY